MEIRKVKLHCCTCTHCGTWNMSSENYVINFRANPSSLSARKSARESVARLTRGSIVLAFEEIMYYSIPTVKTSNSRDGCQEFALYSIYSAFLEADFEDTVRSQARRMLLTPRSSLSLGLFVLSKHGSDWSKVRLEDCKGGQVHEAIELLRREGT